MGAERAHRDWWQDGPARGVRGARTGPAWPGIAVGGQTPSFLCALGVSAAVEGAGGGLCKGKISARLPTRGLSNLGLLIRVRMGSP